jgi:hypothetical protein
LVEAGVTSAHIWIEFTGDLVVQRMPLRCSRIHQLHWGIAVFFVMGPPSHPAL